MQNFSPNNNVDGTSNGTHTVFEAGVETAEIGNPNATPQMPTSASRTTTPVSALSGVAESTHDQVHSNTLGNQNNNNLTEQQSARTDESSSPQIRPNQQSWRNGQPPQHLHSPSIAQQTASEGIFKRALSFISEMKSPISLILVYAITVGIISTSSSANGLLAKTGITSGFLLLNILALANNYAFVAAVDKVWERFQWGDLLRGGEHLTTFLALSSSTGPAGWIRMLFRRRKYSTDGYPRFWSFGR